MRHRTCGGKIHPRAWSPLWDVAKEIKVLHTTRARPQPPVAERLMVDACNESARAMATAIDEDIAAEAALLAEVEVVTEVEDYAIEEQLVKEYSHSPTFTFKADEDEVVRELPELVPEVEDKVVAPVIELMEIQYD